MDVPCINNNNCLNAWRPYCKSQLTNQDANYNPRRTLLTILRQYRSIPDDYKLVWFWCEITVPSIARQLALHCTETAIQSTVKLALPGQKTSWTYWTLAFIHRLTFSTTVNTTNGCMEQDGGVGIFGFADLANFWLVFVLRNCGFSVILVSCAVYEFSPI